VLDLSVGEPAAVAAADAWSLHCRRTGGCVNMKLMLGRDQANTALAAVQNIVARALKAALQPMMV